MLLGFGILFTGMESMKVAVNPLAEYKGFTDLLATFGRYPILGLLLGFGITAIIQSSSAAMGMLVTYIIWTKYRNLCNFINIKYRSKQKC